MWKEIAIEAPGVLMGAFDGYEGPWAFWADMQIDARHAGDFARVAFVADEPWIEWATKAGVSGC